MDDPTFSIAEVAEKVGVSAHTLRYYERIGLLDVDRRPSGHRRYTQRDIDRVVFITRLRSTCMAIRDIQHYFRLVDQGPSTEQERLAVLLAHRSSVEERIARLESALEAIEHKIAVYGGACAP